MAGAYPFNEKLFRDTIRAFASNNDYPTPMLEAYYDAAGYYVANNSFGPLGRANATPFALNLMTAHLIQIGKQVAEGSDSGITISATIDKISTTMQEMQLPNQWQYWLGSTEYGRQLLALLQVKSVGGFYTPGGLGRAGFRF